MPITPLIFAHEFRDKFLNPEPLERRLARILALGRKYDAKFTFFITTGHLRPRHEKLVRRIVDEGHELGSHSHDHLNFGIISYDAAKSQISRSVDILSRYYPVSGFRAPYLRSNEAVAQACQNLGLVYQSSDPGVGPMKKGDFWEIPVTRPMDYEVIQIEHRIRFSEISDRWCSFPDNGEVLLFHPWRIGARRYIGVLERMLGSRLKYKTIEQYIGDHSSCSITFDLDFLETRQVFLHTIRHLVRSPHIRMNRFHG